MIKSNVKDGSFVKHTIGETLEAGWLVKIADPESFPPEELGYMKNGSYFGIVMFCTMGPSPSGGDAARGFWQLLLPNGKKPIVRPDEVELIAG